MICRDRIILGVILVVGFLILGIVTGFIGISYPVRVDNTALTSPVKVERIVANQIELVDGRIITLSIDQEWKDKITYSKNLVEVDATADGSQVWIYGDRMFMLCGTPWAQPIRIPIIPNRIPMNHRQLIAVGEITKNAQRGGVDQPATEPQLEPSGNENPNSESKPRTQ